MSLFVTVIREVYELSVKKTVSFTYFHFNLLGDNILKGQKTEEFLGCCSLFLTRNFVELSVPIQLQWNLIELCYLFCSRFCMIIFPTIIVVAL